MPPEYEYTYVLINNIDLQLVDQVRREEVLSETWDYGPNIAFWRNVICADVIGHLLARIIRLEQADVA